MILIEPSDEHKGADPFELLKELIGEVRDEDLIAIGGADLPLMRQQQGPAHTAEIILERRAEARRRRREAVVIGSRKPLRRAITPIKARPRSLRRHRAPSPAKRATRRQGCHGHSTGPDGGSSDPPPACIYAHQDPDWFLAMRSTKEALNAAQKAVVAEDVWDLLAASKQLSVSAFWLAAALKREEEDERWHDIAARKIGGAS